MSVTITDIVDPRTGGFIAVSDEIGIAYPLTPCCNASAKGMDVVVCRGCFEEVSPMFGMAYTRDEMPEACGGAS